jgi:hypothetical protein
MKKTLILTIILLTFSLSIFAQQGTAVAEEKLSVNEGSITAETPDYKVRGNNLDYLEKLARPILFGLLPKIAGLNSNAQRLSEKHSILTGKRRLNFILIII